MRKRSVSVTEALDIASKLADSEAAVDEPRSQSFNLRNNQSCTCGKWKRKQVILPRIVDLFHQTFLVNFDKNEKIAIYPISNCRM